MKQICSSLTARIMQMALRAFVRRLHVRHSSTSGPLTAGTLQAGAALLALAILFAHGRAIAQVNRCVTIQCPTNQVLECAIPQGTTLTFAPAAQTICGGTVQIVCTPPSGSVFPPGTNMVACVAMDDSDNTARCEFSVTVRDTSPPEITAPTQIVSRCTSPAGAALQFATSATDNCDPRPIITCSPPPGTVFPIGTTAVTCNAVDQAGNPSTAIFPVTVTGGCDESCIELTYPRDLIVPLTRDRDSIVDFTVTATNTCTGETIPVRIYPPPQSAFPLGSTTVELVASYGDIERRTSFHITVTDTTPPAINIPSQVSIYCTGWDSFTGIWGSPFNLTLPITDNVDSDPDVMVMPPAGSWLPVGTNEVTCVATDFSGNSATNHFQVIVNPGALCQIANADPPSEAPNWDFEFGLATWTWEGGAFDNQPTYGPTMTVKRIAHLEQQMEENIGGSYWPNLTFHVGHHGRYWVGTAEESIFGFGSQGYDESLTGTLTSKSFTIEKRYITFLIGGQSDDGKLRVELLVEVGADTPGAISIGSRYYKVELTDTGHGKELMRRQAWPMDQFGHHVLGKNARIRIVDESTTGHLNVDDFRFVDTHPLFQQVSVGAQKFPAAVFFDGDTYDWDSPIWGVADLHTHPMSHLGFGGKVMHGQPDGDAANPADKASALGDCNCTHGGHGEDNTCGNWITETVIRALDNKAMLPHTEGWTSKDGIVNDYVRFRHWPAFNTIAHQQMWYEWVKRAHDGGLRVMVALCVNNPLLGAATVGGLPYDDLTVSTSQIQALKDFVQRHDDFMEVAYDPFQLRDIVRRNKLAIIIGSELDDIGNFCGNPNIKQDVPDEDSKQAVRDELDRLHSLGLRYIFPVHLMNNKFGHTPIGNMMLNIANRYLNGEAFEVEAADPSDDIQFRLPEHFDISEILNDPEVVAGLVVSPLLAPFVVGLIPAVTTQLGVLDPITKGIDDGLSAASLLGAVGLIGAVPADVWPVADHYPHYPQYPYGTRNVGGLTDLGRFAIQEMMKRGMMLDADHMSQHTFEAVAEMAENNYVGYPLNSGHNGFRVLETPHAKEGHRTTDQLERIRELGGLFGAGWENGNMRNFMITGEDAAYSSSEILNTCAGTSKTFGQNYLMGLEVMRGHNVALGTDINGLIASPGPRFGPNSAFGLGESIDWFRSAYIGMQTHGVRYQPLHGTPITGPALNGPAVDPGVAFGFGRDDIGYPYSQAQRDFFVALRIYYYLKPRFDEGWDEAQFRAEVNKIIAALSGGYHNGRVKNLALGLIKGPKNWDVDLVQDPNNPQLFYAITEQLYAKAVCRKEQLNVPVPDELLNDPFAELWIEPLRRVWGDYREAFSGKNTPLKRCKTGPKDWDINFEGVAHYGMLPDFFQDLTNVGLQTSDLDPLFGSAEAFAQMWTKTLKASWAMVPHFTESKVEVGNGLFSILLTFTTDGDDYGIEEADDLDPRSWRPVTVEKVQSRGNLHTVRVTLCGPSKFYRLSRM